MYDVVSMVSTTRSAKRSNGYFLNRTLHFDKALNTETVLPRAIVGKSEIPTTVG